MVRYALIFKLKNHWLRPSPPSPHVPATTAATTAAAAASKHNHLGIGNEKWDWYRTLVSKNKIGIGHRYRTVGSVSKTSDRHRTLVSKKSDRYRTLLSKKYDRYRTSVSKIWDRYRTSVSKKSDWYRTLVSKKYDWYRKNSSIITEQWLDF